MENLDIIHFLKQPDKITENDLELLEEFSVRFPYCQLVHTLIALYTHQSKSMLAPQKLRQAATYSLHRNILEKIIYQKLVIQNRNTDATSNDIILNHITSKEIDTPEKESFFDTFESQLEENATNKEEKNIDESAIFFENLDNNEHPIYEAVNEGVAMGLYYDGNVLSSIKMYKKLMLLYPSKKDYYKEQLLSLLGKKAFIYKEELADLENLEEHAEEILAPEPPPLCEPELYIEDFVNNSSNTPQEEWIFEGNENLFLKTNPTHETPESNIEDEILENFSSENEVDKSLEEKNEEKIENETPKEINFIINEEKIIDNQETEEVYIAPTQAIFKEEKLIGNNNEISFFDTLEIPNQTQKTMTKVFPEENQKIEEFIVELPENITENDAIIYFQKGDLKTAILAYQKLKEQNPSKTNYYQKQIEILNAQGKEDLRTTEQNVESIQFSPHATQDNEYTEELALKLFAQGRISECIFIYEKLAELYPHKKEYYESQIEIMRS
jgi:tetratricopeptide (TPR) repeat protein